MNGEEIEAKLQLYADVFNQAKARVNNDAIATAIVQEIGKHMRVEQMAALRRRRSGRAQEAQDGNGNDQPATQKQLEYLKDLGVEVPAGITKERASELIEEALAVSP